MLAENVLLFVQYIWLFVGTSWWRGCHDEQIMQGADFNLCVWAYTSYTNMYVNLSIPQGPSR